MDGITAIVILLIGFLVISSVQPQRNSDVFNKQLSRDLLNILSTTKIRDLCSESGGVWSCDDEPDPSNDVTGFETLLNDDKVSNLDNTMLEAMGELYYNNENTRIEDTIRKMVYDHSFFNPEMYGVAFYIEDVQLYSSETDQDNSRILLTSKRVIMGVVEDNSGNLDYWGPYVAEMRVWQR